MTVAQRKQKQGAALDLPCPLVAECYNHAMGAVDYLNREALTVYRGHTRTVRVWKHIFFVLLHLAVYVAYCCYHIAYYTVRFKNGQPRYANLNNKAFRLELADQLCAQQREHTVQARKFRRHQKVPKVVSKASVEQILAHTAQKIAIIPKFRGRRAECAWCRLVERQKPRKTGARKAKKHGKRSSYGCAQCGKGLCLGACFVNWHEALFIPYECDAGEDDVEMDTVLEVL